MRQARARQGARGAKDETARQNPKRVALLLSRLREGKGAEEIIAACDGETPEARYRRILRNARDRLRRAHPELVEVFNLIVKNGSNRKESIWTMVSRKRTNGRQQETDTGRI